MEENMDYTKFIDTYTKEEIQRRNKQFASHYDDIKTDIENHKVRTNAELKQNIVGALSELMRDSISFKDTCINALYGRIEDEILRHEDKEAIDNRILKLESDIKLLFEAYDNLEEEKSSNQEIE